MNTAKLPGFAAEASLPATERYRTLAARDPNASHGMVVPQFCYRDCVDGWCAWRCIGDHPR
jgi:hypothetical protein